MQISGTMQSRQQVHGLCIKLSRHGLACVELKGCCRPLQGSRCTLGSPVRRCRVAFCGGSSKDSSKLVLAIETADCLEAVASPLQVPSERHKVSLLVLVKAATAPLQTRSAGMASCSMRLRKNGTPRQTQVPEALPARHWLLCLTASRSNTWRTRTGHAVPQYPSPHSLISLPRCIQCWQGWHANLSDQMMRLKGASAQVARPSTDLGQGCVYLPLPCVIAEADPG
jgi:hypothetical protein